MNTINSVLTAFTELLLRPFAALPPQVALVFYSLVTGIIMAFVFGKCSYQTALKAAADRSRAQLLAIKLFKDDLSVTFSCMIEMAKAIVLRLAHSLLPTVVLFVPLVFIMTQLALRYEYRALRPGEAAVVELQLSPDQWQLYRNVPIEAPSGVSVETAPLRDEQKHTVYWRIRLDDVSRQPLRWQLGDQVVEKQIAVSDKPDRLQQVSVRRPGTHWFQRLLHPGEAAFGPRDVVAAIAVHHPNQTTPIFGIHVPWWATFFIVSIAGALLAKPWLKVQF